MSPSDASKILAFTYDDYGQANPMLSIVHELAVIRPDIELHVASFKPLNKRLPHLQALIDTERALRDPNSSLTPRKDIVFHACKGISNMQGFGLHSGGMKALPHPGGFRGCFRATKNLDYLVAPLDGPDYLESFAQCRDLIEEVQPKVVVVDILFRPALDACRALSQRFVVMNTISYKECAAMDQPVLDLLTRIPASCTGYPYPVPWHLIPVNIFINLWIGYNVSTNPRFTSLDAYRKAHANLDFGFYEFKIPNAPYLCPSFPETDFPFFVPENVTSCGPFIFPYVPVEEKDPELARWLGRGPTVLVNLGSQHVMDGESVWGVVKGLRIVFANTRVAPDLQVLWKFKRPASDDWELIEEVVGKEIRDGKVKVIEWLEADPASIVAHPNVVCSVHHGGANSYNEAIWAGVPHVVLPVWYDTYDFASRVEYLGVGVYGNKACSPNVEAREFGHALARVVGSEAERYRAKARGLRDVCWKRGSGREIGAKRVLELAGL
ncbi:hypothetical protein PQX77_020577 [Marasmius sp. AFHP31]|nr:hypothetical protein PQX77_020577 [Marasmius sp. AFHP31]